LLARGHPTVLVSEPRRIAARAAAARVAIERAWCLGNQVGYQVRFEHKVSPETRLRYLTEGILTRQLLSDPFLETVGAVVLDEFHERNIDSDLALALLREIRNEVRPDLIFLVMSATLDAGPVARFLGDCPIVHAEGRSHPVSVEYRPASRPASPESLEPLIRDWLDDRASTGHLLVFLPGLAEIRRLWRRLDCAADRAGALVLPLHSSVPAAEQDRALGPSTCRKIILSTNIAETSLTIDGVEMVIDSGLARVARYDAARSIDRLSLERISRASADQRAGRAGRTGPGRCIRMWSTRAQCGLDPTTPPEIERVDLSATVLALHSFGFTEPARFPWFEAPPADHLAAAERLLVMLGAVAGQPSRITPLGARMLELPVHPRLSRLLLAAADCGRMREGAAVAALLSEKDIALCGPFDPSPEPAARRSVMAPADILARLDMLADAEAARFAASLRSRGIDPSAARQAARLRDDLIGRQIHSRREVRHDPGPGSGGDEPIRKWLLLAYPDRVVKRRGAAGTGLMVGGRGARLAPGSVIREDAGYYLALDAREQGRDRAGEVTVSIASVIRVEWLEECFPESVRRERTTRYDDTRRAVMATTRLWYHDLLLREDTSPSLDAAVAGSLLFDALKHQASALFQANPRAAAWLARVEFLSRHVPELEWPAFDDAELARILEGACQGKTTLKEIEELDLVAHLESRLDSPQSRELRASAPEWILTPAGRRVRLTYESGRPPILAARLQELFGWTEAPRLARGRVPVLLHILGPNNRPVQVTDDLHSFWTVTYHRVRKDLRARYPKHAWPENPLAGQRGAPDRPE
jgi:ATP-dependent helicase HrpB